MKNEHQKYLIFDFETRSEADLKLVGAWEYSKHHSTQTFCCSFAYGTKNDLAEKTIYTWSPVTESKAERKLLNEIFLDPEYLLVAHNAGFEQAILKNVLSRRWHEPRFLKIPPERFLCTASYAAALALPRALEKANAALRLSTQKDTEGRKLILKYTKPRKALKKERISDEAEGVTKVRWHSKLSDLHRIIEYCENDIRAEIDLFLDLIALPPSEREVWLLDQKMNQRGFTVDTELVDSALHLISEEDKNILRRTKELTAGEIEKPTQRDATLRFLAKHGVKPLNLQAKTVEDLLKTELPPPAKEMLQLRQSASKTSTAKYIAFKERSKTDGRCRDNLMYHGASTGRFAGTGVQPQNFPRPTIKDMDTLVDAIKMRDLEWLRTLYGDPMAALSSALRGCIVASPGKELFVSDYNAIEARVLFWVADHHEGIKAFLQGRDLYIEMASVIYNIPVEEILKDSIHRFLGKETILGSGYGMGWKRMILQCEKKNILITEREAKNAIESYRNFHRPVPELWKKLESAACSAVRRPDKKFITSHTKWYMRRNFLVCELPSGRCLYYCDPEVKMVMTPWGEPKPSLRHMGVDPITKQWVRQMTWGGTLTENVVQAISRDLMVLAMLRIEKAGWDNLLSVHDELIAERDIHHATIKDFENLMCELPPWGKNIPIKAEGFICKRYRK